MVHHWLHAGLMRALAMCALALVMVISRPSDTHAQLPADATVPVSALPVLSSRVKPFEKIYVLTGDGKVTTGRFSRVSDTSLTVLVKHGRAREIPAVDVQRVWRRTGTQAKRGLWIGAMVGAAVVTIPALADSDSDLTAGDKIVFGTFTGGLVGGFYGAIVGAFIPKGEEVYRASAATVCLAPLLAPGRRGVMVGVRF